MEPQMTQMAADERTTDAKASAHACIVICANRRHLRLDNPFLTDLAGRS